MNVNLRLFEVTTVNGPVGEVRVCLVYRLMSDLIKVVLPTWKISVGMIMMVGSNIHLGDRPQLQSMVVFPLVVYPQEGHVIASL